MSKWVGAIILQTKVVNYALRVSSFSRQTVSCCIGVDVGDEHIG